MLHSCVALFSRGEIYKTRPEQTSICDSHLHFKDEDEISWGGVGVFTRSPSRSQKSWNYLPAALLPLPRPLHCLAITLSGARQENAKPLGLALCLHSSLALEFLGTMSKCFSFWAMVIWVSSENRERREDVQSHLSLWW